MHPPSANKVYFPRIKSFIYGIQLPFVAGKLILRNKTLFFWSLLPIAITGALYIYLISALQEMAQESLHHYIISFGWDPEGWTAFVLTLFTKILLLLIAALTFVFASSIVASPFNDLLAEQTEKYCSPPMAPAENLGVLDWMRTIGIDLLKAIAATFATIVTILLSWVPILNLFAFAITFLLFTFQYTSYPQTRRRIGMKAGLAFLLRHFFACVGFGMSIAFLFSLPFFSALALPLAVVGGTLLVGRAAPGTEFQLK